MVERQASIDAVVSVLSWGMVVLIFIGSSVAAVTDHVDTARQLGFLACAGSAFAATVQIRRWACRICELIRHSRPIPRQRESGDVRPLR